MEVLINCSVLCVSSNSLVVPWTISAENVAERTVEQYFVSTVQKYLPSGSRGPAEKWILRGALLGRSKEALDNIELNVPLRIAANMFGGFLRYHVVKVQCVLAPQTTSVAVCRNAFDVLMASPARCNACYPKKLELVKNRKDELFNDLVDFLQANKLVGKEESSLNFVSVLCNCLWTIDGHQDTMTAQFCPVPSTFESFCGYNLPEKSKHAKRKLNNLCSQSLHAISSSLFDILQGNYWKSEPWSKYFSEVQSLACSILQYAEYLDSQVKKVKVNHTLPIPVRDISESMQIKYIVSTRSVFPLFLQLNSILKNMNEYEYLFLNDLCPDDPRNRYHYLQSLQKNGLEFPTILCSHTPGNNKGNLHFIWRISYLKLKVCQMHFPIVNKLFISLKIMYQHFKHEQCVEQCSPSLDELHPL